MREWRHLLTQFSEERAATYRAEGWWVNRRLVDYLDDVIATGPDRVAIVDRDGPMSYGELARSADNVAAGLAAHGVEPGEVVTCQLPNWREVLVVALACGRLGAVYNGVAPIFRERDLAAMVRIARPRVLVVPDTFHGFSHAAMAASLQRREGGPQVVFVIGEDDPQPGLMSWRVLTERDWGPPPQPPASATEPDAVAQLAFTSGTTGEPKGILHTHNTVLAATKAFVDVLGLGPADVFHMASTLGHQTGFLFGVQMGVMTGGEVVLQENWDAVRFTELIEAERVTMTNGAIPFLSDLLHVPDLAERDLSSLRYFGCFGAGLPRPLAQLTRRLLPACRLFGGWGMTETGLAVINPPKDTLSQVCDSDGVPINGTELRVLDEALEHERPAGVEGELVTRGPLRHLGFAQPELSAQLFLEGDWYVTGDRGSLGDASRFTMSARSKDIIIRGGENIPVVEVENLLLSHPGVRTVSVVAVPDERLGERACACVIVEPGASFTIDDMSAWLSEHQLTTQYWPEMLEIFDAFPTTASGKTQKFRLRELVAARRLSS